MQEDSLFPKLRMRAIFLMGGFVFASRLLQDRGLDWLETILVPWRSNEEDRRRREEVVEGSPVQ